MLALAGDGLGGWMMACMGTAEAQRCGCRSITRLGVWRHSWWRCTHGRRDAMLDGQERHIKCPTAEIIHNDLASPPFLSRLYAIAAVVGSLMMQRTCRPTMTWQ